MVRMRDKIQKLRSNAICGAMDNRKTSSYQFPHGQEIGTASRGGAEDATCPSGSSDLLQRPGPMRPVEGKRGSGSSDPVRERRRGRANSAQPHGQVGGDRNSPPGKQGAGTRPCLSVGKGFVGRQQSEEGRRESKKKKKPRRDGKAEASNRQVKGSREK